MTTSKTQRCGSPTAEYSDANQFAAMLKAQTSKSLRDRKALSITRSTTMSGPRRSSFNSPGSEHLPSMQQSTSAQLENAVANGDGDDDVPTSHQQLASASPKPDALSFKSPTLSFQSLVERETRERERDGQVERSVPDPVPVRPVPIPPHQLASLLARRVASGSHSCRRACYALEPQPGSACCAS